MARSQVVRIDKDIARKIREVQKKLGVNSTVASKAVYYGIKPNKRGRPKMGLSKFLRTSANDFDIQIVYNPKKKKL